MITHTKVMNRASKLKPLILFISLPSLFVSGPKHKIAPHFRNPSTKTKPKENAAQVAPSKTKPLATELSSKAPS
jgi:hypothetical protein